MIRLIASDLDGTLLVGTEKLPDGIFEVIRALRKKGILFAAASGRQYTNLRKLFYPVHQEMAFICENGALNVNGEKRDFRLIPRAYALELIEDILSTGMELQLSTPGTTLLLANADRKYLWDFFHVIRNTCTVIDDPSQYADELIKISGFRRGGLDGQAERLRLKWKDKVHAVLGGPDWLDFTMTSKGDGLSALCQSTGIPLSDVMAFGDQFNDEAMLDLVGHPYLMVTAPDALKRKGYTPCENVMGVLKALLCVE